MELSGLFKRVTNLGYTMQLSDEAKDFIADKGYDVQYGARPLKRAIQRYLEDELADVVLSGDVQEGDTILMEMNESKDGVKAKIIQ